MRRYLLLGTGLALLAGGTALAQMPPPDMGPGSMNHDGMNHDQMDHDGHGPDRMEMMHEWRMRHMRHREAETTGAAFRLKRGGMEIDIRCSPSEPTMACINGAATLIDRLNGNPAQSNSQGTSQAAPSGQGGAAPGSETSSPPSR